jgi:hypothetical protein
MLEHALATRDNDRYVVDADAETVQQSLHAGIRIGVHAHVRHTVARKELLDA